MQVNPIVYLLQSEASVAVFFSMFICVVHPGLGLNCMQDLGVEETSNVLDKPSVEPHNNI